MNIVSSLLTQIPSFRSFIQKIPIYFICFYNLDRFFNFNFLKTVVYKIYDIKHRFIRTILVPTITFQNILLYLKDIISKIGISEIYDGVGFFFFTMLLFPPF